MGINFKIGDHFRIHLYILDTLMEYYKDWEVFQQSFTVTVGPSFSIVF